MAVGTGLILLSGALDFITGHELNLNVFYVLPIFLLSWSGGRWEGLAAAAGGAALRTLVDLLDGRVYSSPLYPAWNTAGRLVLFSVIALLASTLRQSVDSQRVLARIDHLTGAANKRAFEEVVSVEIDRLRRYRRPFTLAYVDVDNFKSINDSFGHEAGDRVLKRVVEIRRSHLRASDIVARLGGDEFGLLLPEADETAARSAISKIQAEFAEESNGSRPFTVSIGSLTCTADGLDVSQLLDRADRLMYSVKIGGKNGARFEGSGQMPGTEVDLARS